MKCTTGLNGKDLNSIVGMTKATSKGKDLVEDLITVMTYYSWRKATPSIGSKDLTMKAATIFLLNNAKMQ